MVRPKVLYVAGWGRSGSTLLARILGELPGFVSVGELRHLWRRGLIERWPCGCGTEVPGCPFWLEVFDAAFGANGLPDPRRMALVQQRHLRLRQLPFLRRPGPTAPDMAVYAAAQERLYRAVADVSGAQVVVDSSKEPGDAVVGSDMSEIDLSVVHLVRDPRAVAYSWSRRKPYPGRPGRPFMVQRRPFDSSLRWLVWNAAVASVVRRSDSRYLLLRYEDLVARPEAAVEGLLELLEERHRPSPWAEGRVLRLGPSHTIGGNPDRLTAGEVTLKLDDEWRRAMTPAARVLATLPALPLLHRYGYGLLPG